MTARTYLLLALIGAAACKQGTQIVDQCTSDSECPQYNHCALAGPYIGSCLCSSDLACNQDGGPVVCNPSGFCQVRVGCVSNADCDNQGICDTTVGQCVTGPTCSSDLDCPIGQICDISQSVCVPGCHSNGDCPIQEPCVCSNGLECMCPPDAGFIDPATYDRSQCEVGFCGTETCAGDTSLCPYNDDCVGQADGGQWVCQTDPRMGILCQDCVYGVGEGGNLCSVPASQGANFCLIDLHGLNTFCGADCSHGQSCPSGYDCDPVIILTENTCSSTNGCALSTIACTNDSDAGTGCPTDSPCINGFCGSYCVADEGNNSGFCTCISDSDCPRDTCDEGFCGRSQQPCIRGPTGDAYCASLITCLDNDGARGCYIGRNCAPSHGLHCPITQQQ